MAPSGRAHLLIASNGASSSTPHTPSRTSNFRVIGHGDTSQAPADWGRVRIVYVVYPSDAIVFS